MKPLDLIGEEQVLLFAARRLEVLLADRGAPLETVRAVLSQRGHCPALAAATVRDLQVRIILVVTKPEILT